MNKFIYLFILFFSLISTNSIAKENIMILKLKYGDVKFGNSSSSEFNLSLAGTGGSDLPNLKAEFSDIAHTRGILSAARSSDPDSANSQFFICFDSAPHLDRQYSAFGKVIKGMEFVDMIKKGEPNSGAVSDPDKIISLKSK